MWLGACLWKPGFSSCSRQPEAVYGCFITPVSMSDALGIHLAEESDPHSDTKQIWLATLVTLVAKFIVSLSFAVPLLIFPLEFRKRGFMLTISREFLF